MSLPTFRPEFAQLQLELAFWRRRWRAHAREPLAEHLARQGREYSRQVLAWSGLLGS